MDVFDPLRNLSNKTDSREQVCVWGKKLFYPHLWNHIILAVINGRENPIVQRANCEGEATINLK